jgi:hypothetical protein
MSDTKVCSKCGRELPATTLHFGVYRASSDGLCPMCKPCRSAYLKARKLINSLPPDKAQTARKRSAEIYRIYHKTNCDSPAKERLFADYNGIKIKDLKNIITEEEEKAMLKKWTDEENQRLLAEAPGASMQRLAEAFGTSVGNITWRLNMLRKKQKEEPARKAATINEAFDAEFPKAPIEANAVYAECAPEEEPAAPPETVNARIAKLCELPDPPAKVPEKKAAAKPTATIFDRAHDIITLLRHNAEDQEISIGSITITINESVIDASGTNAAGECVGWHKKRQPAVDQTAD